MTQTAEQAKGILMSDAALKHVKALQQQQGGKELCLRVGVRQGGCSGMSYTMDFEDSSNINEHDEVYDYDGFRVDV
jgi:iron-sulfur cluster assembly protein